jgi:hypothetical protein
LLLKIALLFVQLPDTDKAPFVVNVPLITIFTTQVALDMESDPPLFICIVLPAPVSVKTPLVVIELPLCIINVLPSVKFDVVASVPVPFVAEFQFAGMLAVRFPFE